MDKRVIDALMALMKNKGVFGLKENSLDYSEFEEIENGVIIKSKNKASIKAVIAKKNDMLCDIRLVVEKEGEKNSYCSHLIFLYEENRFIDSYLFDYIIDLEEAHTAISFLRSEYLKDDQNLEAAEDTIYQYFIKALHLIIYYEKIDIKKIIDIIAFKENEAYYKNKSILGVASIHDIYYNTEIAEEYVQEVYCKNEQ